MPSIKWHLQYVLKPSIIISNPNSSTFLVFHASHLSLRALPPKHHNHSHPPSSSCSSPVQPLPLKFSILQGDNLLWVSPRTADRQRGNRERSHLLFFNPHPLLSPSLVSIAVAQFAIVFLEFSCSLMSRRQFPSPGLLPLGLHAGLDSWGGGGHGPWGIRAFFFVSGDLGLAVYLRLLRGIENKSKF